MGVLYNAASFAKKMVKVKLDIMFLIVFQQCQKGETMAYSKLLTSLACRLSSLVIYNVYLSRSLIIYIFYAL